MGVNCVPNIWQVASELRSKETVSCRNHVIFFTKITILPSLPKNEKVHKHKKFEQINILPLKYR